MAPAWVGARDERQLLKWSIGTASNAGGKGSAACPRCGEDQERNSRRKQKRRRIHATFGGVPSGARSRNLLFHRQALCRLSYRHHVEEGGRVSRVLFLMVISLGPFRDRPRRRLRDGSRLPASASNLQAADSEIAAGRIALFTLIAQAWSLLLSRARRVPIWTVNGRFRPLPRLSPGTLALCSPDFPLARMDQRPSP